MTHIPSLWHKAVTSCFGAGAGIAEPLFYLSKKNQVTLLKITAADGSTRPVIAKMFCWGEIAHEAGILEHASALRLKVPAILGRYRNILFMQYLKGPTLNSLLARRPDAAPDLLAGLGSWLARWHRSFPAPGAAVLLKGDLRLQNFIVKNASVYGIDFEESRWGHPLEDLAEISATLRLSFGRQREAKAWEQFFWDGYLKIFPIPLQGLDKLITASLRLRARFHKFNAWL